MKKLINYILFFIFSISASTIFELLHSEIDKSIHLSIYYTPVLFIFINIILSIYKKNIDIYIFLTINLISIGIFYEIFYNFLDQYYYLDIDHEHIYKGCIDLLYITSLVSFFTYSWFRLNKSEIKEKTTNNNSIKYD